MPPTLEEEVDSRGDTIVVKGEYPWSRPSSPNTDSMSPEIDVTRLLAQLNTPQHLESPEPLEDDLGASNLITQHSASRADQIPSSQPRSRTRMNATTMEERLIMMPDKRPLPWRDGVEPGADVETGGESRRKQIRYGCLLSRKGDIQEVPCRSCATGRGKFRYCIKLDGFFKGACASCQLSGRPNRCSIKKNDDDVESPSVKTPAAEGSSSNALQFQTQPPPSIDAPQPKRRKTDTVPEWESARPQWEQELGESHARQQMRDIVQRPWATVNSPTTQSMLNGMNGSGSNSRNISQSMEHRNSMGWAAVNQPPSGPTASFTNVGDGNGLNYRNLTDQAAREETVMNDDGSVALIDTLPKNKQRQIYAFVSGLEGGIENLRRELISLKRALGIDDED